MPHFVFLLDLVDDPELIAEYDAWHTKVWPEVLDHLKASGYRHCQIHRSGSRLVMLTEADSPTPSDGGGRPVPAKVAEWEEMMNRYHIPLPWARPGHKWTHAEVVFDWRP